MDSELIAVTVKSTIYHDDIKKSKKDHQELDLKNKKKQKKLGSTKLNKSPSLKSSSSSSSSSSTTTTTTTRPKSHLTNIVVDSPSDDIESPPYSTSSSSQSSSTLSQKSAPILTRRSSFNKGVRTLTRMSSKKQKKPAMKIVRSRRPVDSNPECDFDSPSSSSKSVKESPRSSEHSFDTSSSDKTKRTLLVHSRPNLIRKASLRPFRVSTKTNRRSPIHSPGIERATCSSALKGSKMPNSAVQIPCCEIESEEGHSGMKACPFSYCSLHGHRHKSAPPLKRLISIRRRMLWNDRNVRIENQRDKPRHGNKVSIGVQTDLVDEFDREISFKSDTGVGAESVEEVKIIKSYSLPSLMEDSNQSGEFDLVEHNPKLTVQMSLPSDRLDCCVPAGIISKSGSSSESLSELQDEEPPNKEEKENLEPDQGPFKFPPRESEQSSPNNMLPRTKLKDQKYLKMWQLMYKHAVKELPGKAEENKTEQQEVAVNVLSEDDQGKTSDNVDESYQIDAVNLVQKAFDEILLPEIQEQGQAIGEVDLEEKMPSVSKSWSSLKKIFILKRLVKALEKVKQINRGTVRHHLPLQVGPEAERVNLRRQSSEERRNVGDWMLDYALQKVVSKLEPDQQRRVAMLVKAFETVLPLPDANSSNVSTPRFGVQMQSHARNDHNSVGVEENFSNNVLAGTMLSRGQGTEATLGDDSRKEGSFSSNVDDQLSRFSDKYNSDAKKSRGYNMDISKNLRSLESVSVSTPESAQATQLERQSYMKLWGFVYRHMMANIPYEVEDEKKLDNAKTPTATKFEEIEDDEDNQKAVLRRVEAIKLIEKAIDDVIVPDNNNQDSPSPHDGQSTGSDEEPQAKKNNEVTNADPQDNCITGKVTICNQEEGIKSVVPEKQMSKNWSILKKKILLSRFIKAFDNARKFSPRGLRFLPIEAEPEAEKVNLRRQEMDERKKAEEWMVDHALQQAVARLTPARMRKVQLLVEAFETVTPCVRP